MIDQMDMPLDALAAEILARRFRWRYQNRGRTKAHQIHLPAAANQTKGFTDSQLIMPPPAATSSLTLPPLFHARKLRQTLRKITVDKRHQQ